MEQMTSQHITVLLLSLGLLIGLARFLGELAQRLHQPAVLGELLAGVVLGPTILGNVFPEFSAYLFPAHGPSVIAMETVATLAVVLFMMVAGIEVDLSTIWKQGRAGIKIGISSLTIPFVLAFAAAWFIPKTLGRHQGADPLIFTLFFAIALSISALPVIAKTLMDLGLYRSDLGMVVISAAVFSDLAGWIMFAIVLSMMDSSAHTPDRSIMSIISSTLLFAGLSLTIGRWLIHKILPFLQTHAQWPGGVICFSIALALFGAAYTEWIGIHAIFGSFLVGVAIGDSTHLREHTRVIMENFISFIFAPLFFASIGLKVNFAAHFDFVLVLVVLLIACGCKLAGGILGARWAKLSKWDSLAVGFGLNSRGAMEIILGLLAMNAGLIRTRLFVALVIMAIVTSMISGPMMRFCLGFEKRKWTLRDVLSRARYLRDLRAQSHREAIEEIVAYACRGSGLNEGLVIGAVWGREKALKTGIGSGVAIPHARINGLSDPLVTIGISEPGIDFDAPDGSLAHIIFLVLMPNHNSNAHLEFVPEIARLFRDPRLLERLLHTQDKTKFFKIMNKAVTAAQG